MKWVKIKDTYLNSNLIVAVESPYQFTETITNDDEKHTISYVKKWKIRIDLLNGTSSIIIFEKETEATCYFELLMEELKAIEG